MYFVLISIPLALPIYSFSNGIQMFTFVNSDSSGTVPKRQQTQRACEPCRRRKKRCRHLDTTPPREASLPVLPDPDKGNGRDSQSGGTELERSPENSLKDLPSTSCHNESLGSRFVGDLNPESVFLVASSPDATRGVSMNDSVGVWLRSKRTLSPATERETSPFSIFYGSSTSLQKAVIPMLRKECIATVPPLDCGTKLTQCYFENMHPILPIIDKPSFYALPRNDSNRIILLQGMCLAASKLIRARKSLKLGDSSLQLSPRQFAEKLTWAMRNSIELGLVTNKIVLIQALALLAQFADAPDEADLPSQFCGRVVHHVQSIGLHVEVRQGEERDEYGSTLLTCVWVIDRLNAAINGRPVIMHERDFRKDLQACFDQQSPCLRLLIKVTALLDLVIGLYRPSTDTAVNVVENRLPAFESLVMESGADNLGASFVSTIEILYHAIAILSCRSKTLVDTDRSSISFLHQTLAATNITAIDFGGIQSLLIFFPFVPYTVSLALSVVYRELRYSKLATHRSRARLQFEDLCKSLKILAEYYRSAETNAKMGANLLEEIDRVASSVVRSQTKISPHKVASAITPLQNPISDAASADTQAEAPTLTPAEVTVSKSSPIVVDSQTPDFSSNSALDLDVDLFEMFDPAFNLDDFDACLESNLNPTFSTYPWEGFGV